MGVHTLCITYCGWEEEVCLGGYGLRCILKLLKNSNKSASQFGEMAQKVHSEPFLLGHLEDQCLGDDDRKFS